MGLAKTPAQTKDKPVFKFESGEPVVCIKSASPGYKLNHVYTPYKNDKGIVCLKGDDGFEDMCSMLVSSFKRKE